MHNLLVPSSQSRLGIRLIYLSFEYITVNKLQTIENNTILTLNKLIRPTLF